MTFNRTSPLPARGRGVQSLRGGVREHDGVQNIIVPSGSRWLLVSDAYHGFSILESRTSIHGLSDPRITNHDPWSFDPGNRSVQ